MSLSSPENSLEEVSSQELSSVLLSGDGLGLDGGGGGGCGFVLLPNPSDPERLLAVRGATPQQESATLQVSVQRRLQALATWTEREVHSIQPLREAYVGSRRVLAGGGNELDAIRRPGEPTKFRAWSVNGVPSRQTDAVARSIVEANADVEKATLSPRTRRGPTGRAKLAERPAAGVWGSLPGHSAGNTHPPAGWRPQGGLEDMEQARRSRPGGHGTKAADG
eukprot:CAMPEP_0195085014 /NCGR_PEP_ID=MMETSP0448-20130528/25536_1 /TAXON_ID=66468 /ORGANISM="Heterocapsa triquestra, Strain CCMP 448" /LENGTH=221 /DNA_ID=CAMNT_0040118387 /DNA_START=38 /DNA_END=699 /DNA_ORIENTATION=-